MPTANQPRHDGVTRVTPPENVGDDMVKLDMVDILTMPVAQFERRMAQQYRDWDAFTRWTEVRRGR